MLLTSSWGHARESRVSAALWETLPADPPDPPDPRRAAACSRIDGYTWSLARTTNHFLDRNLVNTSQNGSKSTPFTEETYKIAAKIDLIKRSHEVQRARNPGYTCK